jgi:hypothetical protein
MGGDRSTPARRRRIKHPMAAGPQALDQLLAGGLQLIDLHQGPIGIDQRLFQRAIAAQLLLVADQVCGR